MRSSSLLCVAHPGHELRMLQWLTLNRPLVLILTDGSGSSGSSRLEASRRLITASGATPGPIFGRYTDRALYELILQRDIPAMLALSEEIAGILDIAETQVVVSDMAEGFNSGHDLCNHLIRAAVARLRVKHVRPIRHYEVALERLDADPPGRRRALTLTPTPEQIACTCRKIRTEYPQMIEEMERVIGAYGIAAATTEVLYEVESDVSNEGLGGEQPYYEKFGAARVSSGRYREVIIYADHIRPLSLALREWSAATV